MSLGTAELAQGLAVLIHSQCAANARYLLRCPTECSLLSTEPGGKWSCQISLRLHFDSRGERQFRTQSIHFGPLLADAREVEVWLRRAQGAILSPHRPHTDFHDLDRDQIHAVLNNDSQTLKFSQNAVVVDIKDPEATDLLFIDLPGWLSLPTAKAQYNS